MASSTKTSSKINTKTKSNLKANNAGYAVTKKGITTYYKSSKDAPGYNDTFQGKGTTSKGNAPIKSVYAGTNTPVKPAPNAPISSETLKDTPTLQWPTKPQTTNVGNIASTNNYGLQSPQNGLTFDGSQFTFNPQMSEAENAVAQSNARMSSLQEAMFERLGKPVNKEKAYNRLERDSGIRDFQQQVSNYSSQLNAITAKRDADILSLEGQGRGQTEGFIGGEQARINREAAIAALPVQAQLASAQGNLEMAQSNLETLWRIRSSDIDAEYQYNKDIAMSLLEVASKGEQNLLNAKLSDIQTRNAEAKDNLQQIREWSKMALQSGQSHLISQFGALDPRSETFSQDFARVQSQVRDTTAELQRESLRANIEQSRASTANAYDTIRSRQEADAALKTPSKTISGKPQTEGQAKANTFADRLLESEAVLQNSNKFASFFAVGGNLPNYLKTEDRQEFEQAQRNFINAVLRRESGAVISDQEFENARQQYFPQRGDSEGVLAQKAANRNTVINGFYREANVLRPVSAGDIVESNGIRYKIDDDGVTLIEI